MNSLKEVYNNVAQHDQVKVAAARAAQGLPPRVDLSQVDATLLKQAQDYDQLGRILAHQAMADLIKQALDEAGVPEEKKEEALADAMATARGEKKDDKKKEDRKEGEGDEEKDKEKEEKVAAIRQQILAKMAKDPSMVARLAAKHQKPKAKMPPGKPMAR